MTETEKTTKVERKAQKVKQAQAEYRKAVREKKKQERKAQDQHKYMMGGCVVKYFPEGLSAFDFDEQEMNGIIAFGPCSGLIYWVLVLRSDSHGIKKVVLIISA